MRRMAWLVLALPAVLAAAPTSYDDPEALLRQADAAFAEKQMDRAAELYERAGVRTTEPSRAAFNLATARYRQAREGQLASLGAAEVHYRACLASDEYRAKALFGLGNCLLLRATAGPTVERTALRAAIDRYGECLAVADKRRDAELATDAKYNRARARLLLLQAPPPQNGAEEQVGEPKDEKKEEEDTKKQDKKEPDGATKDGEAKKAKNDAKAQAKDGPEGQKGDTTAGKGQPLPNPSENPTAPPLAKEDAEKHLEEAARKIRDEAAAFKKGRAKPPGPGVKDW